MTIEFGLCDDNFNTQYAPLAALVACYKAKNRLRPLEKVDVEMKTVEFTPADKLEQFIVSVLAGCETVSEVNNKLRSECLLANVGGWEKFAAQATIARAVDGITQKQIESLREAGRTIWWRQSRAREHDWRSYLWLDFDLSGLPCGKQAQGATKGYFTGQKTELVDS